MAGMAKIGPEVKTIAGLNALVYLLHGAPKLSDRYFDITGVGPLYPLPLAFRTSTFSGFHPPQPITIGRDPLIFHSPPPTDRG